MTKFTENKLLIASGNKGKIKEISKLLEPFNVEVISAAGFNLPEPEENGSSFIENAEIKSRYYSNKTGLPALADDSGLCIEALNNAPGIYSARWAGKDKDFSIAMKRIEDEMGDSPNRGAKFVCALSLYLPETDIVENFEGKVEGIITFPARGENGFGYDPIFIAHGMDKTFAQIEPDKKHSISHRADAFNKLINKCFL
ncbi:MAG: RdgB/HAM1 family non-canonical purine NTP pyrophosphatase [Rickettsiales bacterium]|nr:RdgB/HAM1 family non-canonical purine NTP pyrophosphatase [Pseudomonadota bacterium]MDA0966766.1 RdgB/HAM1 family non-canonical purine NTP pyrophosphatase [Pseudomonadota bacterium]MDG4543438.1 RdgB/HAM1 family non-canonical purine NTP pyrophosphatase [Rickettsiales bacterium]MDG4546168.1 RdgB/HAM1 family non-canonical purine NTP pyrophosphatase [Rickettsiales bacterium]MDG4547641.1 RdgB/HAM1 family non-canonical purine NTP pyrophosphatase [Rickettsiales bacterium]